MKKTYITPEVEEINVEAAAMIASSPVTLGTSEDIINSADALGNERRGSWGNLWGSDR